LNIETDDANRDEQIDSVDNIDSGDNIDSEDNIDTKEFSGNS
jgi:hypothetical protein